MTADGYPHTSVGWCDLDGECLRVNTMRGFVKDQNMRRNPRVTLLCYDPHQPLRYLEVRGRVKCSWRQPAKAIDALLGRHIGGKAVLHID